MIKLKTLLLCERSNGLFQWYKRQLPNWPDYVIKDLIFTKLKSVNDLENKKKYIDSIRSLYPSIEWRFETLSLTFDSFDKNTKAEMKARNMGKSNPGKIPDDETRHQVQADLIKTRGISKQPIIVVKQSDGYELVEGWHRTLQYLQHFPNGFICPAWVGHP